MDCYALDLAISLSSRRNLIAIKSGTKLVGSGLLSHPRSADFPSLFGITGDPSHSGHQLCLVQLLDHPGIAGIHLVPKI